MPVFRSRRERRLWLCVLGVVAAIYSTLGLAGLVAEGLGDLGLLDAAIFLAALLLVGATIVLHGVRVRPSGIEIVVWLGLATVFLLLFFRMTLAERSHLIEYGVLGIFIYEALSERQRPGEHGPALPMLAILATAALGLIDECVQIVVPSRVFDPIDILFNGLAGTLAVGGSVALSWVRRRWRVSGDGR